MSEAYDSILHEADVREVIESEIAEAIADGDVATDATAATEVLGQLLALQQPAITDASVAHALNSSFTDTEVESALNALGGKINSIIAVLEAYGFIDT